MCEHGTSPPQSQSVVSAHRDTYREKLKTKSREELQKMLEAERPGSTRTGPYGVYDDVDVGENVKDIERQLGLKAPSGELYVNLMPRPVQGS